MSWMPGSATDQLIRPVSVALIIESYCVDRNLLREPPTGNKKETERQTSEGELRDGQPTRDTHTPNLVSCTPLHFCLTTLSDSV